MLLQRQYSLPNCTLRIEGLSSQSQEAGQLDVVTVCECDIVGQPTALKGGKDLLVALLSSVPTAAQTWLSGVKLRRSPQQAIQVEAQSFNEVWLRIPGDLVLLPEGTSAQTVEICLTWLQLADLVEALDQFCSDSQTLPTLTPAFQSLPRRAIAPAVPLRQQLTPLGIGAASLVVMAAIFFHLPVPERRPEEPQPLPTAPLQQPISNPPAQN